MINKRAWLLPLAGSLLLLVGCGQATTAARSQTAKSAKGAEATSIYCAGSLAGVNQTVWDPIQVTRTGQTYTLVNTASPVFGRDYPFGTGSHSTWPSGMFDIAGQLPMTVEASGDTVTGGEGYLYREATGDTTYDAQVQKFIAAGSIYYKWELRGATMQAGASGVKVCQGGLWAPAPYTTTAPSLAESIAASDGPDAWVWPGSSKS
jgi:hypothetical protein